MASESIASQLERLVDVALEEWDLRDIDSYGQSGPSEAGPDDIGYARWHTSPYCDVFHYMPQWPGPVQERPSDYSVALAVDGEAFHEFMRLGRLSAGMMLLFSRFLRPQQPEGPMSNSLFWLHYSECLFLLTMAADRLRSFFVHALHVNLGGQQKSSSFCTPFVCVRERVVPSKSADVGSACRRLCEVMDKVAEFRRIRHDLAHSSPIGWARVMRDLLLQFQQEYDEPQISTVDEAGRTVAPTASGFAGIDGVGDPWKYAEVVINAYRQLIEAGNLVFFLESEHRDGKP